MGAPMKTLWILLFALAFLGLLGCSIKDEDRCPEGFEYDKEYKACRSPAADGSSTAEDSGTSDGSGEAKDGATGDGSEGDAGGAGFGDPCEEHSDCVTDADYCAYDDITQSGMCTYKDCTADSCPEGYLCCDCTAVGKVVMCGPDDEPMLQTFCECMTKTQ